MPSGQWLFAQQQANLYASPACTTLIGQLPRDYKYAALCTGSNPSGIPHSVENLAHANGQDTRQAQLSKPTPDVTGKALRKNECSLPAPHMQQDASMTSCMGAASTASSTYELSLAHS